jgi:hypothetical protein
MRSAWDISGRIAARPPMRLPLPGFTYGLDIVLLVDATHVSCRDKRAGTWRLHCAYDLLQSRLAWVRIGTQHVGEGFAHLRLAHRRYPGGRWGLQPRQASWPS